VSLQDEAHPGQAHPDVIAALYGHIRANRRITVEEIIIVMGTSHSAKQTVLLHITQQTILTPEEIANSTYIYTACRTRAWSATIASASQPALIPESSMPIG
jgi:hypothetical protein